VLKRENHSAARQREHVVPLPRHVYGTFEAHLVHMPVAGSML
jgi:hypothetical protein